MPFSLLWTKEVFFSFCVTHMMALRDLPLIFFYMQHGQTKEFSRFCIAIMPLRPMNHIILKWLYLSMFKTFACQNFSSLLLHKIYMTKTTLPDASSIKFPHLCHRLHKDHQKKSTKSKNLTLDRHCEEGVNILSNIFETNFFHPHCEQRHPCYRQRPGQ